MALPTRITERWSMDFVADQISNGRRFRILNVVGDYSREFVGQLMLLSITGQQVTRFLSQLFQKYARQFTLTRLLCRFLLSRYRQEISSDKWAFGTTNNGKPIVTTELSLPVGSTVTEVVKLHGGQLNNLFY